MRFCSVSLERRILSWNLKPPTDSLGGGGADL
jgi:hypothetical protein